MTNQQTTPAEISFGPEDVAFLRKIAVDVHSSHLPGTLFFGVGTFAHLLNLSGCYIRDRMDGNQSILSGKKEAMFDARDVASVFLMTPPKMNKGGDK